jgi:hypothetical protein
LSGCASSDSFLNILDSDTAKHNQRAKNVAAPVRFLDLSHSGLLVDAQYFIEIALSHDSHEHRTAHQRQQQQTAQTRRDCHVANTGVGMIAWQEWTAGAFGAPGDEISIFSKLFSKISAVLLADSQTSLIIISIALLFCDQFERQR